MAKLPDDLPIRSFPSATAFGRWLAREHRKSPGMWLKIPKKDRGKAGPTYREALEEALRFGWIDSQKAKLDDDFYLQRFTPRGPQSRWSKINRKNVEALIAAGRMMPAGMKEVDAAKRDGRWKKAYASQSSAKVPADLKAALDANPKDDIGSTVAVSKVFDDDTGVVVITNTNTPDLFGFYKTAATLSTPDVQTRLSEAALNAKQHAETQGRLNRVG